MIMKGTRSSIKEIGSKQEENRKSRSLFYSSLVHSIPLAPPHGKTFQEAVSKAERWAAALLLTQRGIVLSGETIPL